MYDAYTHTNTRTTHKKSQIIHVREEKACDNNYYYNYNKTLRVALET